MKTNFVGGGGKQGGVFSVLIVRQRPWISIGKMHSAQWRIQGVCGVCGRIPYWLDWMHFV